MLFLATFFPMSEPEEGEGDHMAQPAHMFLRATVDMADLIGIYLIMSRVSGKGSVKVLVAGVGWAFAELLLTRLVFLWVGARGVEFDWRYIQKSLEANISLLHFTSLAALVWVWSKRSLTSPSLHSVTVLLTLLTSYKGLMLAAVTHQLSLSSWASLALEGLL